MNICILGWYGTETLGDRAILDGIIRIFSALDKDLNVSIGSLYPVVTERTIYEDINLYQTHTPNVKVTTFNVKDRKRLHYFILSSDAVLMGGGPLMDLNELFIIEYAFRYAKSCSKRTALLGCGYGPLQRKAYIKCLHNIVENSDLILMRSALCQEKMQLLCDSQHHKKVYEAMDPAIISVISYRNDYFKLDKESSNVSTNIWCINVRDLDYVYGTSDFYYPKIVHAVKMLAEQVNLCFIPMHTFIVGGDDRLIFNRIAQELQMNNLNVINKPLSLRQCYDYIINCVGCIGMRYHSIVFQTYLNGNNYILDYTDRNNGKNRAFLNSYDKENFYRERYAHILDDPIQLYLSNSASISRFKFDSSATESEIVFYRTLIEQWLL